MPALSVPAAPAVEGARIQRSYVIALDPSPAEQRALLSNCGGARVAYNAMLAIVKTNLDQRTAEKTYGLDGDDLTLAVSWSKFSLSVHWNTVKAEVAPWWAENSRDSYRSGINNLAAALDNFAKSRRGTRAGAAVGFPKFKSRAKAKLSVKFEGANVRLDTNRHSIKLPRIGLVHTHQSTAELARLVERGLAKVNSVTVSHQRGRWQASFQVEQVNTFVRRPAPEHVPQVVGIDVGVKDLIVVATPDGVEVERIPAPQQLKAAQGKLRQLQKKAAKQHGPYDVTTGRRQTASAGWHRTQERIRALHTRVANLRENHLHQVTTRLAQTHTVIGVEHLNLAGMVRAAKPKPDPARPGQYLRNNRAAKAGLSRAISDASLGELLRMLDYKTSWYGAQLVRADRFYPSSKTCSGCGTVKAKLSLATRVFDCDTCGARLDRDLNAAINIARYTQATADPTSVPDEGSSFVSGGGTEKTRPRTPVRPGTSLRSRNPTRNTGTPAPQGDGQYQPGETRLTLVEN